MNSHSTKTAAVVIGLSATWATAHADPFKVTFTSTADIDHLQVFSERSDPTFDSNGGYNSGTSAVSAPALTADFGTVVANSPVSVVVSTAYGTSVDNDFYGTQAGFSVLGTQASGALVVGGATYSAAPTYASAFGATNVSFADARAAVLAGSVTGLAPLFPGQSPNMLYSSRSQGVTSGEIYAYGANGTAQRLGAWSVTPVPVPEPATMAALGVGTLGLMRRRRKLA